MAKKMIEIGGRLHDISTDHVVAGADEILYEPTNGTPKKQSEVNVDTYEYVANINAALQELSRDQTEALALAIDVNTLKAKSVRSDEVQSLTDTEKAQALANLGISGVDDEPAAGSSNLVKSGGVFDASVKLVNKLNYSMNIKFLLDNLSNGLLHVSTGAFQPISNESYKTCETYFPVISGSKIYTNASAMGSFRGIVFYNYDFTFNSELIGNPAGDYIDVPADARYVRVCKEGYSPDNEFFLYSLANGVSNDIIQNNYFPVSGKVLLASNAELFRNIDFELQLIKYGQYNLVYTNGYYINSSGVAVANANLSATLDYYPVRAGKTYKIRTKAPGTADVCALYDTNKVFLSSFLTVADADYILTPAQDGYIRLSNEPNSFSNSSCYMKAAIDYIPNKEIPKYIGEFTSVNSHITLYEANKYIDALDGSVHASNNYDIYKLEISDLTNLLIFISYVRGQGGGISIAATYTASDKYIETLIASSSLVDSGEKAFKLNSDVSYLLFTKAKSGGVLNVSEYSEGESLMSPIIENIYTMIDENKEQYYVHTIGTIATSDLKNVLYRLMTDDSDSKPSKQHRYELLLGPYTYNLDCSDTDLELGYYIMPYTTLKGRGQEKTKLQYLYNGNDDDIMVRHSTLNAPYTCVIEDMTVEAKNIRYPIHSDGGVPSSPLILTSTSIILRNVHIIHYGFDAGLTPSYKAVCAWGAGIRDDCHRRFENCIFESYGDSPFFCHNLKTMGSNAWIDFVNCEFISHSDSDTLANAYHNADCVFATYGDINTADTYVTMVNCKFSRYIHLATESGASTKPCWHINVDNNQLVDISTTDNINKKRVYSTGNCRLVYFDSAVEMGTPIILTSASKGRAFVPSTDSEKLTGVVLSDVSAGEWGYVGFSGTLLRTSTYFGTFASGKLIGYDGTGWVEDNTHPIAIAVTSEFCKLL